MEKGRPTKNLIKWLVVLDSIDPQLNSSTLHKRIECENKLSNQRKNKAHDIENYQLSKNINKTLCDKQNETNGSCHK